MQPIIDWTEEEKQILSKTQLQICEMHAGGASYQNIAQSLNLSGNCTVASCIRRTLAGNIWTPSMGSGGISYLSDVDTMIFFLKN